MRIPIVEEIKNFIGLKINSPLRNGARKDFIFIHINKTAGTSIIDIIGKPFRKHLTAKEIIKTVGQKKWDQAYKFTVVRNPWDKVVSHYKHNIKVSPKRMLDGSESISFKKWVRSTFRDIKIKKYYNRPQHFLAQVDWLKDFDGHVVLDKIVRFENLIYDFNEVSDILELGKKLPHLNKTKKSKRKTQS